MKILIENIDWSPYPVNPAPHAHRPTVPLHTPCPLQNARSSTLFSTLFSTWLFSWYPGQLINSHSAPQCVGDAVPVTMSIDCSHWQYPSKNPTNPPPSLCVRCRLDPLYACHTPWPLLNINQIGGKTLVLIILVLVFPHKINIKKRHVRINSTLKVIRGHVCP